MAQITSVFVSATSRDLGTFRRAGRDALFDRKLHPVVQDHFPPDYQAIIDMLRREISQCDAVVHLAGFVYGAEPKNRPDDTPRRSYTQLEFEIAVALGKPVFVFLANEDCPFDKHEPDTEEFRKLQLEHRDRLKARSEKWETFSTVEELVRRLGVTSFPGMTDGGPRKPNNLPFESIGDLFKGRAEFVAKLRETLLARPTHAAVVAAKQAIHGLGGVGKTRLAIEYGWKFAPEYTAILFATADSPDALRRNLAALCRADVLDLPEKDEREEAKQFAAVLCWLGTHPGWFLVLDNADTPEAATAVEELLPRLAGGHVVVTSRLPEWGTAGVEALELDVLDPRAAAAYLLERTQGKRRATPTDDADALALAGDVDGLALGLEQAGAFVCKFSCSLADYRSRWAKEEKKVREWYDSRMMKCRASVAVTWQTSIDQLSEDGRALLNVLAWLAPDPIPVDMILKQPPESEPDPVTFDAENGLADLRTFSLVKRDADGTTATVHRLVQDVTRARIPEGKRRPWIETALRILDRHVPFQSDDVRTWAVWDTVASHAATIASAADAEAIAEPTDSLMVKLGLLFTSKADYRRAEPLMRRALAIYEKSYGPEHPDVATALNNLGALLQATNRLADAEPLMRRALAIDEKSYGPEHPDVAIRLNNLASLLQDTNRLADAEPLMRRALAIDEKSYGPEHPYVARDLNNLGRLLQATNRLADAEPLMRRALAIDEKSYGPEHPYVAIRLNNLASLLQATNRLADAEPLMRRVVLIMERSLGPEHPNVATALNNLASLLQDTNRLADAEPLMRRALAIDEKSYGPEHPNVARDLNNLGQLLQATNRLADAEPLMRRVVLIMERSLGPEHPNVATALNNLASLLQATNRLADAEPLMRRVVLIMERSLGPEHPNVATGLNNLAMLLKATGRLAEAEPLMRRALAIDEKSYGPEHPYVATDLNNLGLLLQDTNRLADAEPLMRRVVLIMERSLGPEHPNVATALNNLASLLQATNRLADAEPLMRRAVVIFVRSLGPEHPHSGIVVGNYRRLLAALKLPPEEIEARIREVMAEAGAG